jgi:ribosomal protein S18 acetylase RimI-like enzyme
MTAIQFQLRQATHSDLPEIAALLSEGLSFDGLVFVQTAEELAEEFDGTYCSLDHDVIVAIYESSIIGVGYTIFLPSETKEERCYIFGTTKPEFRGNGVGTAVMKWASEHGESLLRSTKRTLPKYLRSDMSATNSTAGSLFQSFNMSPVRWNDDLIIDLADSPVVFTAFGYSIVAWDSSRDEEARVVKNLAFMDHWGSTPTSEEGWKQLVHGSTAKLDQSFFALDSSNNIVGLLLSHRYESDDETLGKRIGWIDKLATLSEHRGKAIGRSLITHALAAYRRDDLTHAALDVDTENPTGAYGLYTSVGFSTFRGKVTYERIVG